MRTLAFCTFLVCYFLNASGFTCTETGLFPNPSDDTCQSYIFCFKLSDFFTENVYNCPNGTLFDPQLNKCIKNFTCGTYSETTTNIYSEITTQTTTIEPSNDFTCTAQGRFPEKNDTTCKSYYYCYYLTNGQYLKQKYTCPRGSKFDPQLQTCSTTYQCEQTTTTVSTDFTTSETLTTTKGFKCTQQGKFPVKEDISCSSYYYCLYLPTGDYVQNIYKCPNGEKFDGKSQKCSRNFNCTILSTTTVTQSTANTTILETFKCTSVGRFPTEDGRCEKYHYCYYNPNGEFGQQIYRCEDGEYFDPEIQSCSGIYKCSISTTTEISPVYDYKCTSVGKFPRDDDSTCITYYYCFYLPNGELGQQLYSCTAGETFDPELQKCSQSYQCSISTTTETSTSSDFNCTQTGKFPVEEDATCTTYYYCFYLPNGEFGKQLYGCTAGERFDPELQICNRDYQCPVTTTTDGTSTSSYFECTKVGKFPVEEDSTCRTYYYCFYLPNGEFGKQLYGCTAGETFDPELQTCSHDYQCPLSTATEITSSTTELIHFTTEKNPSTTEISSTTAEITTSSYFECKKVGRFAVEEDTVCQTYYYCFYLPNGEFGKQLYGCKTGEKFDPELQICSHDYKCLPSTTTEVTSSSTEIIHSITEVTSTSTEITSTSTEVTSSTTTEVSSTTTEVTSSTSEVLTSFTTEVTSTTTGVTSASSYFECQNIGRFRVEEDTACLTYYYCFYLPNGELGQQLYSCGDGERFDPVVQRCNKSYNCPLQSTVSSTQLNKENPDLSTTTYVILTPSETESNEKKKVPVITD